AVPAGGTRASVYAQRSCRCRDDRSLFGCGTALSHGQTVRQGPVHAAAASRPASLPKQLKRKLNISRVASGAADLAKLRGAKRRTPEAEFRMIEQVEEFRAELYSPLLVDGERLED